MGDIPVKVGENNYACAVCVRTRGRIAITNARANGDILFTFT